MTELHIVPLNDIYPHVERGDCPCNPDKKDFFGTPAYIHNSYDRKEIIEEVEKVLKNHKAPK